jgi:hypothetical protein
VTSYAVTARVQPASPRIREQASTAWSMPRVESDVRVAVNDTPSSTRRPAARLDSVRLTLAESTFYLFDPEGWR